MYVLLDPIYKRCKWNFSDFQRNLGLSSYTPQNPTSSSLLCSHRSSSLPGTKIHISYLWLHKFILEKSQWFKTLHHLASGQRARFGFSWLPLLKCCHSQMSAGTVSQHGECLLPSSFIWLVAGLRSSLTIYQKSMGSGRVTSAWGPQFGCWFSPRTRPCGKKQNLLNPWP